MIDLNDFAKSNLKRRYLNICQKTSLCSFKPSNDRSYSLEECIGASACVLKYSRLQQWKPGTRFKELYLFEITFLRVSSFRLSHNIRKQYNFAAFLTISVTARWKFMKLCSNIDTNWSLLGPDHVFPGIHEMVPQETSWSFILKLKSSFHLW